MNTTRLLSALSACILAAACSSPCSVVWTEGAVDADGRTFHTLELRNPPAGTGWTVWFCQYGSPVAMEEGAPATIEHISGTLYRVVPVAGAGGSGMTVRYEARPLVNRGRAPEGFCLQKKGKKPVPLEASYVFQPCEEIHSFGSTHVETSVYDMIPRLKSFEPSEGSTDLSSAEEEPVRFVPSGKPGWYRITVEGGRVRTEASDEDGAFYAGVTLANIRRRAAGKPVPDGTVTDWPDLPYRGLMLDVSRNFTKKEDLLRLLDMLAHYKVNRLHLHFGDDEGWRIGIDALPELTRYGAFRAIPELLPDGSVAEPDALMPACCITPGRDSDSPGNGFYSHEDFVEILRYAYARRILVVPEFDMPGHSRAAIKSMEVRALRTGDASCLLSEPEDSSRYCSVQDYTDNVINVALPSTYRFIETVFDALAAMYEEAGVPLEAIHIGGDEVPEGAWTGSPACRALMDASGMQDAASLKDYFLGRVLDIAEARGVKLAGWQDICEELQPATLERLKKQLALTNLWTVSHGRDVLPYQFANAGIPVVISSAPNCYVDFAYNYGKMERGHSWGGFVDERRTFSLLPYDMYRSVRWDDRGGVVDLSHSGEGKPALTAEGMENIIGVQGQLWSETIRTFDHVTYYIFPKAAGLFERGWNASPAWEGTRTADDPAFTSDFDRFFSIITDAEYPYYESLGISYHRHQ